MSAEPTRGISRQGGDPAGPEGRPSERASTIIAAIRRWNELYGEPPTLADWEPARARRNDQVWRIARFSDGDWPSIATVKNHFGTLNRAIAAAGLRPRAQGERAAVGLRPSVLAEQPAASRRQQVLALRVRSVVTAADREDPTLLVEALNDLAVAAFGWADEIRFGVTAGDRRSVRPERESSTPQQPRHSGYGIDAMP